MLNRITIQDCCGCGACVSACPVKCISFVPDKEGFSYPKIDTNICVNCGKCMSVCPFAENNTSVYSNIQVYGSWSKDEQIKFRSSSGGVFSEIARYIIDLDGVVFGAVIENDGTIAHCYATTEEGISRFCKSKYVQSDIGNSYIDAKKFLEKKKIVLFSGTPCQILALHRFLGKDYPNLYTIDLICVGVSSPGVWKAYLNEIEKEKHSKISNVIFRHKKIDQDVLQSGNRNLTMKIEFEDGQVLYQYYNKNEFFEGFLSKLFLRPSCKECKVKNFTSGSDIQLGDFWDIEKIYPEVLVFSDDNKRIPFGVSEILICTEKGKKLFQAIKEKIVSFQANLHLVKKAQIDTNWFLLVHGSQQHWNRKYFFDEFAKNPENVRKIIRKNLGLRNMEYMSGKNVGMWGSFYLRECIRLITSRTDCRLGFQFRASTFHSLMSEKAGTGEELPILQNPIRNKMFQADITKDFRINIKQYMESVDFLILDLLEERYDNMLWNGIVLTKSEGYFENKSIQGFPVEISFEKWKENAEKFITLLLKYTDESKIIIVENYLCCKYGRFNAPKYKYADWEYINSINSLLKKKYSFIKNKWPTLTVICDLPADLQFTDTDHIYGCIPEHANYGAYSYIAQKIAEAVGKTDSVLTH